MFKWLKQRRKDHTENTDSPAESNGLEAPEFLHFKSNDAAFEYATEYMQRPLEEDENIFGMVIEETKQRVTFSDEPKWTVRLATEQGVIEVEGCGSIAKMVCENLGMTTKPIQPGDLVAVKVMSYKSEYPPTSKMQYFAIMTKVKPQLRVANQVFIPDVEG